MSTNAPQIIVRPSRIWEVRNREELLIFNQEQQDFKKQNEDTEFGDRVKMGTLRAMVKSFYDLQAGRMAMGNRIAAQFLAKVYGLKPGQTIEDALKVLNSALPDALPTKHAEEAVDVPAEVKAADDRAKEEAKVLKLVVSEYTLLTKEYATRLPTLKTFRGKGLISNYGEYVLVHGFMDALKREKKQCDMIKEVVETHPLFINFSSRVPGFGTMGTAVLLSHINIFKALYVSSIWYYCGLGLDSTGKAQGTKADQLIDVGYIDEDDDFKFKKSLTYNPWVRARLLGAFAPCLLRIKGGQFRQIYLDRKNRMENMPGKWSETTKLHRHRDAMRYMMKMLILHAYNPWRESVNQPRMSPYAEGKLHMVHSTRFQLPPPVSPDADKPGIYDWVIGKDK